MLSSPLTVRYYVVFEDGQRYGPADLTTLRQWIQEGRVTGGHFLEEESSGRRLMAAELPELGFGTMPPVAPAPMAAYPRPMPQSASGELTSAWVFGVLSIFCGLFGVIFGILGLLACERATKKGVNAMAPMVLNIIGLVISVGSLGLPFLWRRF